MIHRKTAGRLSLSGVTLIELILALLIFSFVIAGAFRALSVFGGKASETLSQRLVLQMEARKALLNLYREIQQGIEVILPAPGCTLPYLVYRDFINNIHVIYLEKDATTSKTEGEPLYKVMEGIKISSGAGTTPPKLVMKYVSKSNFTTHHYGGILLSCSLKGGKGRFDLVNYVRLKNLAAED